MITIKGFYKMEAISYSNARKNLAGVMSEVCDNSEAKIITRGNHPSVVMLSLEDYNSMKETDYLLRNPVNAKHLKDSLSELENGDLVEYIFDGELGLD
jgi:antitoxin YefM